MLSFDDETLAGEETGERDGETEVGCEEDLRGLRLVGTLEVEDEEGTAEEDERDRVVL